MSELKPLNLSGNAKPPFAKATGGKEKFPAKMILVTLVIIALGVGSGYGLFRWKGAPGGGVKKLKTQVTGTAAVGETYGVEDPKAFTDSAEGELAKGGIDGEGSHHLVRPGGDSQNVYLTSSIIDLDQFVGRKVKIWGQTFQAQKAGWLMDVGRLEVTQ